MKFATFDRDRVGIIDGNDIVDLTSLVGAEESSWPPVRMVRLIAGFDELRGRIQGLLRSGPRKPLSSVRLECPVQWPNKVIAFPANYHDHIKEMKEGTGLISTFTASGQGFFLKANSSLSGPNDPIVLPDLPEREVHHECELAVIIGKGGLNIPSDRAMDHVFGYSCLVDVVVRGKEERVMRKSFDSFCPMGPWIATRDEVARPDDIDLKLSINGELRQSANTRDLIVSIPEMIRMASAVMTLQPGDVIASGTPAGVGPIRGGDRLDIEVAGVGSMSLPVHQGQGGKHPVWNK
jgi:2-keto-4-pentenoate hydratase/2-oxohepta-3-ene-1,7-dioic acid hydratase in catechol pathway